MYVSMYVCVQQCQFSSDFNQNGNALNTNQVGNGTLIQELNEEKLTQSW